MALSERRLKRLLGENAAEFYGISIKKDPGKDHGSTEG
jgi:hypothetical protein